MLHSAATWMIAVLVPEPVALPEVEELLADDAGEGGPHNPAHHRLLGHPTLDEHKVDENRIRGTSLSSSAP